MEDFSQILLRIILSLLAVLDRCICTECKHDCAVAGLILRNVEKCSHIAENNCELFCLEGIVPESTCLLLQNTRSVEFLSRQTLDSDSLCQRINSTKREDLNLIFQNGSRFNCRPTNFGCKRFSVTNGRTRTTTLPCNEDLATEISVECSDGFLLQGGPVANCLSEGVWSTKPACIPVETIRVISTTRITRLNPTQPSSTVPPPKATTLKVPDSPNNPLWTPVNIILIVVTMCLVIIIVSLVIAAIKHRQKKTSMTSNARLAVGYAEVNQRHNSS